MIVAEIIDDPRVKAVLLVTACAKGRQTDSTEQGGILTFEVSGEEVPLFIDKMESEGFSRLAFWGPAWEHLHRFSRIQVTRSLNGTVCLLAG